AEKGILCKVIEKATPEERAACLASACGEDPLLRQRVEDLLAKHFQEDGFMQAPAVEGKSTAAFLPLSEGPGTVIDHYKLLEKLGEARLGTAYMPLPN